MARRLQKIICVVLLSLLMLSTFAPAMAQSAAAKVSSSSAKIYKTASTSAKSAKIGKGTSVTVKAVSGKWAKVKVNGKTGYMPVKYLKAASTSTSKSSSSSAKRYTAYASRQTYVYSKASSSASRRSVAVNTKLYVVGKSGSYYKVQNSSGSATGYIKASCVSRNKVSTSSKKKADTSWKSQVVKMDWFKGGSHVLEKGRYGYIYDIDTGITMRIKRMGGHYHADVEPATAADTAKLKRIANGKFSWKSHAVILKAGGKYVASAINTLPHGDQTIRNNNYNGQFCLHTTNSWTHVSSKVNSSHQSAINRAYRWAHK